MPLHLLAVGDLHLGRRPSRLPDELAGRARELGPAGAWERVVAAALEAGVDAVALAGDVVEREHDFFEAYRALRAGVEQLAGTGIRVLAVAGNHDGAVLPRLAREVDGLELLGEGGRWQRVTLERGGEALTLWGWSFPQPRVLQSPLEGAALERGPGPNLGLLHADRDVADSPYAPVTSRALTDAGLDGWLLGHIHQPDALSASQPSGYLGTVTGLDPGEPGPRGPWLVTIASGRVATVDHWPLAPLRWQPINVPCENLTDPAEARATLLRAVRTLDREIASGRGQPVAVGLRVSFTGRTAIGGDALAALFPEDERGGIHDSAGVRYFIETLRVETLPEVPLETLAAREDPAGLLARRLLTLQRPADDAERRALLAEAREALLPVAREARWQPLGRADPDDAAVADWLERAARSALEALLRQQEAA
ncbi:metallophosphoesterase family protein [Spiribacter halobius]|uniref:DNA repair exonuclease n=1 Tax=Sediminicurvatus halobius TaxID=2182432 RepID=A0A2U2N053_9GAMM|nr:metallophosphoesterase [Spiribacter halobius]PWG62344.1 DNA repair exonuclease [Spiribacter halobius]UEX79733.1 metallophosphoesterase [Spiribacter halobius]